MSIYQQLPWGKKRVGKLNVFWKWAILLLGPFFLAVIGAGGLAHSGAPAFAWESLGSSAHVAAVVWPDWARSVYSREHVPYFALHPPVYYTQPVGRPYGWSPFAYPAWVQTPLATPPRPMVIQNPYVVGFGPWGKAPPMGRIGARQTGAFPCPDDAGKTPQPIRITNPNISSRPSEDPGLTSPKPTAAQGASSAAPKAPTGTEEVISSTAAVQPRRIRNPYLPQ